MLRAYSASEPTPSEFPGYRQADNSTCYTTAWGSPYAAPSSRPLSSHLNSPSIGSPGASEDFPLLSMPSDHLHTSGITSAGAASTKSGGSGYKRFNNNIGRKLVKGLEGKEYAGKSIEDFTKDWIDQYLYGERETERKNWLSEDESDTVSFETARIQPIEPHEEDWLGVGDGPRGDKDDPQTPSVGLNNRHKLKQQAKARSQHAFSESNATLKQEDFWDFGADTKDQDAVATMADIPESKEEPSFRAIMRGIPETDKEETRAHKATEKPLPPPPLEDQGETASAALSSTGFSQRIDSTNPRTKKRVTWKKKACVIWLPPHDIRGTPESGNPLLTKKDVEEIIARWEAMGYDLNSYRDHGDSSMSRPSFPEPDDILREYRDGKFNVSFPDRDVWETYVRELQEEKLRALGVSLGDEESIENPSSSVPMSLSSGQFHAHAMTPPIPTSSAASNRFAMPANFSPVLSQHGLNNPSSAVPMSTTSPLPIIATSPFNPATSQIFTPQSVGASVFDDHTAVGCTYPFVPFQQQSSVPSASSYLNISQGSGISPIPPANPTNVTIGQPVSPLADDSKPFPSGLPMTIPQFRQPSFNPFATSEIEQEQEQYLDGPGEAVEDGLLDVFDYPEIAHPAPRGHNHNVSETLQKDVEQTEYDSRSSAFQQKKDEDDHKPTTNGLMKSRWAFNETEEPCEESQNTGETEYPNNLGKVSGELCSGDAPFDASDIDTNPSLAGAPDNLDQKQDSRSSIHGHKPHTSASNLNVAAKEFDPSSSFASNTFSFNSNNIFQPGASFDSMFSPHVSTVQPISHSAASSRGFNSSIHPFVPRTRESSVNSNQNFHFSSATFNVDAPVFNPGRSFLSENGSFPGSDSLPPKQSRIFSDFDPSTAIRPARRSKAIPIVRPDEKEKETKYKEADRYDEREASGRPKRMRRGEENEDQDAAFDSRRQVLSETINTSNSASAPVPSHADGKENTAPSGLDNVSSTGKAPTERSPASRHNSCASPNKTSLTLKKSEGKAEASRSEFGGNTVDKEEQTTEKASEMKDTSKGSTFKPATELFELKPISTAPQATDPPAKKPAGLAASKWATSPERSPTHGHTGYARNIAQESQIDDHSTDAEDINAVMEQLNNEYETDLGVERQAPLADSIVSPSGDADDSNLVHKNSHRDSPSPQASAMPTLSAATASEGQLNGHTSYLGFSQRQSGRIGSPSPVRNLTNPENDHVSDWDDAISSGEEEKLHNRGLFFDKHVNEVVGGIIDDRIHPLERLLDTIQHSVTLMAAQSMTKRSLSADVEHSDADDEDDEEDQASRYRSRSPLSRKEMKRVDRIKHAVLDALSIHQLNAPKDITLKDTITTPAPIDLTEVHNAVTELKHLFAKPEPKLVDIKQMIMDAFNEHANLFQRPRSSDGQADHLTLQLDGLKSMLRVADERADKEFRMRRDAQDSLAEVQRLLKFAAEDASTHRDNSQKFEIELNKLKSERLPEVERVEKEYRALRETEENMRLTLSELSEKNITLVGKLDEFTVSSDHWRSQTERAQLESKELRLIITGLKEQMEEGMHSRKNLHEKFSKLQEDMVTAMADIAKERSMWRVKEEELTLSQSNMKAAYDREVRLREKLELDVRDLEQQEKEAGKLRVMFGQSQQENSRLEELIIALRQESHDNEEKISRLDREVKEARSSTEQQVMKTMIEADSQHKKSIADLEREINEVRGDAEMHIIRAKETGQEYKEVIAGLEHEVTESRANVEALVTKAKSEVEKTHQKIISDLEQELNETRTNVGMVALKTRVETEEKQKEAIASLQREVIEMKITSQAAIEKANETTKAGIESARIEYEGQITNLKDELTTIKNATDASKERHSSLLEETREAHTIALKDAAEAKGTIDDQRLLHERALNDLRERHAHEMHSASLNKNHHETYLEKMLELKDDKLALLQDQVSHFKDKVEIANSAARAAAQAAQNAQSVPAQPVHVPTPSISYTQGSEEPEKISPQALRESILVLQDQLQQREQRIEELEQEFFNLDKGASGKMKEKEMEITWLRELLFVRQDDLQEIIDVLGQDAFEREPVRDAAIRLQANLQMVQHERERAAVNGQSFSPLTSLTSLAATPRAIPLAAAAAWGNWRKTKDADFKNKNDQTLSKPTSTAQSFLSGLLTPPSRTSSTKPSVFPTRASETHPASESRPLRSIPRQLSSRQAEKLPIQNPPRTPPLLRKSSYDHDAESTSFSDNVYADESDSIMSPGVFKPSQPHDELFGSFEK